MRWKSRNNLPHIVALPQSYFDADDEIDVVASHPPECCYQIDYVNTEFLSLSQRSPMLLSLRTIDFYFFLIVNKSSVGELFIVKSVLFWHPVGLLIYERRVTSCTFTLIW